MTKNIAEIPDKPDREKFLDLIADGVQMHVACELSGYSDRYQARRLLRDNAQALQSKLWERLQERAGQAIEVLGNILDAESAQTRYIGARDILDRLGMTAAQQIDINVSQTHEELRQELEQTLGADMVEKIARRAQGLEDESLVEGKVIEKIGAGEENLEETVE